MKFSVKIELDKTRKITARNFEIANNKINFLFGESGIGKTLIAKSILGLIRDENLVVEIDNQTLEEYGKNLGVSDMISKSFYVFQEPSSHFSPVQTIAEQLNEGKLKNCDEKPLILRNLFPALEKKEIDALLKIYPKPFRPSGGEKQRFLNAMAFISMSKLNFSNAWNALFVFDEPTGHLDVAMRNVLLTELVRLFVKDKPTVLFITHDYSVLSFLEKSYGRLREFFRYYEIYKSGDVLYQREFVPDEYLHWIADATPFPPPNKKEKTVLVVKSGVAVYDREIRFYEDENGTRETDLRVSKGEALYLKAPSGEGKTAFAKVLLKLVPARFEAEIDGVKINGETPVKFFAEKIWKSKLTLAFQHADEALNPNSTVAEIFEAQTDASASEREKLFAALFDEPFSAFANKKIKFLSGGQKQKINLLRTLSLNSAVSVLDEPLNGMDLKSAQAVLNLLKEQMRDGKTFIVISHNEEVFDKFLPRKIYLKSEIVKAGENGK